VLDGADDFSSVKAHIILYWQLVAANATKQIAASHEVHLNVNVQLIMEGRVGSDDERAVVTLLAQIQQHVLLAHDMLCMLPRLYLLLTDQLDREFLPSFCLLSAHDHAKSSSTNFIANLEV